MLVAQRWSRIDGDGDDGDHAMEIRYQFMAICSDLCILVLLVHSV